MRSEVRLDEACSLIVDCPHNTAPESEEPFAFAIGTKAISNGRIDFSRAKPVDADTYARWIARATPVEGDLILCREAPVGPVTLVPRSPLVCLGQRTVLLRPDPEMADSHFLLYALLSPLAQTALKVMSEGSTVAHLNVSDIRAFRIELPPVDEQKRIASVLTALDDKIDSNRRLAALLEETAAELFRARFVDFVAVEKFHQSEIGQIPVGWTAGTVANLARLRREFVRGESNLPYIGLDAMPRGSTVLAEWIEEGGPTGQAARFDTGEILFGKLRPYFQKVGVAPVDGRCSTEILVLQPAAPEYYGVLLGHVASAPFIDHCVAVSRGTRMPRAEWADASRFKVAIPPPEIAEEFAQVVSDTYAYIRGLTAEARTLSAIRDELLPKLISGEIRIPAEADEESGPEAVAA